VTRPAAIAVLSVVLLGCGTKTGSVPEDTDEAGDPAVEETRDPDIPDVEDDFRCCPLGDPSCDCTGAGGSPDQPGGCHDICDTRPVGWISNVDDSGCIYWTVPPGTGSCSGEDDEPEPVEEDDIEEAPETVEEDVEPAPDASDDDD